MHISGCLWILYVPDYYDSAIKLFETKTLSINVYTNLAATDHGVDQNSRGTLLYLLLLRLFNHAIFGFEISSDL